MPDPRLATGGVWRAPRTVPERGALDGGLTPPLEHGHSAAWSSIRVTEAVSPRGEDQRSEIILEDIVNGPLRRWQRRA